MGGVMDRWRWQRGQTCHSEVKKKRMDRRTRRYSTEVSGGGERVHGWRYFPQNADESWPVRIWSGPQGEERRDISRRLRSKERRLRDRWRTVPSPPSTSFYLHRWVWKAYSTILAISTANKHTYIHTHINTLKQIHLHTPDGVSILTNVYVCTRVYTHRQSDL